MKKIVYLSLIAASFAFDVNASQELGSMDGPMTDGNGRLVSRSSSRLARPRGDFRRPMEGQVFFAKRDSDGQTMNVSTSDIGGGFVPGIVMKRGGTFRGNMRSETRRVSVMPSSGSTTHEQEDKQLASFRRDLVRAAKDVKTRPEVTAFQIPGTEIYLPSAECGPDALREVVESAGFKLDFVSLDKLREKYSRDKRSHELMRGLIDKLKNGTETDVQGKVTHFPTVRKDGRECYIINKGAKLTLPDLMGTYWMHDYNSVSVVNFVKAFCIALQGFVAVTDYEQSNPNEKPDLSTIVDGITTLALDPATNDPIPGYEFRDVVGDPVLFIGMGARLSASILKSILIATNNWGSVFDALGVKYNTLPLIIVKDRELKEQTGSKHGLVLGSKVVRLESLPAPVSSRSLLLAGSSAKALPAPQSEKTQSMITDLAGLPSYSEDSAGRMLSQFEQALSPEQRSFVRERLIYLVLRNYDDTAANEFGVNRVFEARNFEELFGLMDGTTMTVFGESGLFNTHESRGRARWWYTLSRDALELLLNETLSFEDFARIVNDKIVAAEKTAGKNMNRKTILTTIIGDLSGDDKTQKEMHDALREALQALSE